MRVITVVNIGEKRGIGKIKNERLVRGERRGVQASPPVKMQAVCNWETSGEMPAFSCESFLVAAIPVGCLLPKWSEGGFCSNVATREDAFEKN